MFKFSDIYETDGATCKTKMWRCFSRVAEGSLHYLSDPGGITGYVDQFSYSDILKCSHFSNHGCTFLYVVVKLFWPFQFFQRHDYQFHELLESL